MEAETGHSQWRGATRAIVYTKWNAKYHIVVGATAFAGEWDDNIFKRLTVWGKNNIITIGDRPDIMPGHSYPAGKKKGM